MASNQRRSVRYARNVLANRGLIDRLLDRSGIGAGDTVLEIGAGGGAITARLAGRCGRVVAIERDARLADRLRRRFAGCPMVAIHEGDFLCLPLPGTRYKVFANIPFNITTAIVTRLTTAPRPPEEAHLIVQREAAARFLGRPRESLYAVLLKPWFEPGVTHRFRRADFLPAPRVDVVMLRLRKRGPPLIEPADAGLYRDFAVHAFTAWQPSLRRALADLFSPRQLHGAARLGIDLDATPTAVPFEQWLALFAYFKRVADPRAMRRVRGAEARLRQQQAVLRKVHRTRARRSASAGR
jgi:23S rRNA (adenine-N6)-dimethyltransferase